MRVEVGALLLLVSMTTGCKRSSQVGTGTATGTATATATATVASASATPASRPVAQRTCKLGAPVVANEGRGGITHGIAASAAGVVVTWGELRRPSAGFGPDDAKQRYEMARVFELDTLAARGPAQEIGRQEAVDAFTNGIAPFALDDGTLGTGTCAWAAFAGKLACGLSMVASAPTAAKFAGASYADPGVAGPGPEGDRVAVAGVGDAAVMVMPQCQDVRIVSSAGKPGVRPLAYGSADALGACEPKKTIDVPAITAVSSSEAAAVWRHGAAIEGRSIGKDGMPRGGIITLSGPGGDVGAPAIAWAGDHALVTWAARTGSAPYALAFAHWKLGGAITRAKLDTGAAQAMAPALAPTDETGCVMIAWTEGKGDATHVRAGLACGDALVAASVIDVSAGGVEAGDSELARVAASTGYVVWQELPKGKPAELRVAKITCE